MFVKPLLQQKRQIVCVYVALGIQYAMCMGRIVI